MKNCLLCPKGTNCRGYVLSELILKLYDAVEKKGSQGSIDTIARALSLEDMKLLTQHGDKARVTCWSKGFVLVLARKVADISKNAKSDLQMRTGFERMIVSVDGLFSKLPKGIHVDMADMIMDVYNQASVILHQEGAQGMVPATVLGKVMTDVARAK
ncbi:MAG: hypothetical protein HQL36_10590 [Alphaproteobacteria bacterium]|nr:hypothetical protein [Alphaproteobacteria bacterium]MBF0249733.1 hypothetical protein [Alphaproteobacteria bacterium]